MYELMKKAADYADIIIFGNTEMGQEIYNMVRSSFSGINIQFCDNSLEKQKIEKQNYKVFSVEEALERFPDGLYILASMYHWQAMRTQLITHGIKKKDIIFYAPRSYLLQKEMKEITYRCLPRTELEFEVDIAEHCNLNCKCCDHFSPLAEPRNTDLDDYTRNFERLSFLFKGRAKHIMLLGGEPLLNDQLVKYVRVARENFNSADISIVTNGVLLLNMPEDFWLSCKELGIKIVITKYPIELDYERIERIGDSWGIQIKYFGNSQICKYTYHFPLDLNGTQDPRTSFLHCTNANRCITLKNGKMYTCSIIPNIGHFNKYFNYDLTVRDEDSIDIYKTQDPKEILRFMSEPVPFCRYCKVSERTYGHKWGRTEKDIKEWT